MARCSVCSHAKRATIETLLASGKDPKVVAARFELSKRALVLHCTTHESLPKRADVPSPRRRAPTKARDDGPRTRTAVADGERDSGLPVTIERDDDAPTTSRSPQRVTARSKLDDLLERVDRLLEEVEASEDASLEQRIAAIRAAVVPLKLLGQFTGEIGVSEATVATSTHFKRLLGVILDALRPKEFTAARESVIAALEHAERGGDRVAA